MFDNQLLLFSIDPIRHALDEKPSKDEFFIFGGIHLAAQDVRSFKQKLFPLIERDFFIFHREETCG